MVTVTVRGNRCKLLRLHETLSAVETLCVFHLLLWVVAIARHSMSRSDARHGGRATLRSHQKDSVGAFDGLGAREFLGGGGDTR
jgi:hypothetical protein